MDGSKLRARDGRLSLHFIEPMEEINYLDEVRLYAVDHPHGTEIYPNEYFAAEPPFPADGPSRRAARACRRARGTRRGAT